MCQLKSQCPGVPLDLVSFSQALSGRPRLMVTVVSSPSVSNPLLPGCLHLGVFTSTSKTTCAKSFPIFSHETTLLLGFLSALVAWKARRLETVSYPFHPSLTHRHLGSENNYRCPAEQLGHVQKVVDTADACLCDCMINAFWKIILFSSPWCPIVSCQPVIHSSTNLLDKYFNICPSCQILLAALLGTYDYYSLLTDEG